MRRMIGLGLVVTLALACGGGGGRRGADADVDASKYGSPVFQTYEGDGQWYRFKTDTTAEKTWSNMSCDPVQGTWTHSGDEIHIVWNDVEDCSGYDEAKLRQLSDCSMAEFWAKGTDGTINDSDSTIYERTEPKCPK